MRNGGVRVHDGPVLGTNVTRIMFLYGDEFQEASPTHIRDFCIVVALNYTFACVIPSNASWLKLPRVILGQATITISLCCVDMTFDHLIATGFGSGPVAKAVSLA